VWFQNGDSANAQFQSANAQLILNALQQDIWPKLTGLMGRVPLGDGDVVGCHGGDARLDIYLASGFAGEGTAGQTKLYGGPCDPGPVYILIDDLTSIPPVLRNPATVATALKASVAHEFMHAILHSYKTQKCFQDEYYWLDEATATWAEDYVYPLGGRTFLKNFLNLRTA